MNDILYLGNEFVVADIETTALSPEKGGMIIELAGVKIRDNEIVDTFSMLIDPERKIYPKTTELTGITNDMVKGQPVYGQVLPDFFRFLGDAIFVAHNSGFDWDRYLLYFFKKVGIFPTNKVVDTLALAKLYFPDNENHKLDTMCNQFGISLDNHHRALDDSMATAKMLLEFKKHHATQLYNNSFSLEGEQVDLFNLAFQMGDEIEEVELDLQIEEAPELKSETKSEEKSEAPTIKEYSVKRVKYWEKAITKNKYYRRLYVTVSGGTAYFDIHTQIWYNKDIKETIDFEGLKQSVLKYLNLNTVDDLCNYRN
ncbi:3'-5' exonuclease [Bacillus sp. M6-12]|nr:3'-5' exonuclease [Bacillus sp. M6-12]